MWVKICGIRDVATAEAVCRLRPDAIGLNFYAKSPRSVSREAAAEISSIAKGRVQLVGVFVNHPASEISDLARSCRLDAIQLHGDESADQVAEIAKTVAGVPIFRAWRMAGESLTDLAEHLSECRARETTLAGCLVDSRVNGTYGGSGHAVPWSSLRREYEYDEWPPLILAGGLNAGNVAEAIQIVRPWGVDVASGVELSPGVKSLEQVRDFIANARFE